MSAYILGSTACYRLVKIDLLGREVYAVTVSFMEDNEEVIVGDDEENAFRFLVSVCKNSVTPCTFYDVFSDFSAKIQ